MLKSFVPTALLIICRNIFELHNLVSMWIVSSYNEWQKMIYSIFSISAVRAQCLQESLFAHNTSVQL